MTNKTLVAGFLSLFLTVFAGAVLRIVAGGTSTAQVIGDHDPPFEMMAQSGRCTFQQGYCIPDPEGTSAAYSLTIYNPKESYAVKIPVPTLYDPKTWEPITDMPLADGPDVMYSGPNDPQFCRKQGDDVVCNGYVGNHAVTLQYIFRGQPPCRSVLFFNTLTNLQTNAPFNAPKELSRCESDTEDYTTFVVEQSITAVTGQDSPANPSMANARDLDKIQQTTDVLRGADEQFVTTTGKSPFPAPEHSHDHQPIVSGSRCDFDPMENQWSCGELLKPSTKGTYVITYLPELWADLCPGLERGKGTVTFEGPKAQADNGETASTGSATISVECPQEKPTNLFMQLEVEKIENSNGPMFGPSQPPQFEAQLTVRNDHWKHQRITAALEIPEGFRFEQSNANEYDFNKCIVEDNVVRCTDTLKPHREGQITIRMKFVTDCESVAQLQPGQQKVTGRAYHFYIAEDPKDDLAIVKTENIDVWGPGSNWLQLCAGGTPSGDGSGGGADGGDGGAADGGAADGGAADGGMADGGGSSCGNNQCDLASDMLQCPWECMGDGGRDPTGNGGGPIGGDARGGGAIGGRADGGTPVGGRPNGDGGGGGQQQPRCPETGDWRCAPGGVAQAMTDCRDEGGTVNWETGADADGCMLNEQFGRCYTCGGTGGQQQPRCPETGDWRCAPGGVAQAMTDCRDEGGTVNWETGADADGCMLNEQFGRCYTCGGTGGRPNGSGGMPNGDLPPIRGSAGIQPCDPTRATRPAAPAPIDVVPPAPVRVTPWSAQPAALRTQQKSDELPGGICGFGLLRWLPGCK